MTVPWAQMSFHQLYLEYPDVLDHVNLDASNKPVLAEVKIKNKNLHRWFTSASLSEQQKQLCDMVAIPPLDYSVPGSLERPLHVGKAFFDGWDDTSRTAWMHVARGQLDDSKLTTLLMNVYGNYSGNEAAEPCSKCKATGTPRDAVFVRCAGLIDGGFIGCSNCIWNGCGDVCDGALLTRLCTKAGCDCPADHEVLRIVDEKVSADGTDEQRALHTQKCTANPFISQTAYREFRRLSASGALTPTMWLAMLVKLHEGEKGRKPCCGPCSGGKFGIPDPKKLLAPQSWFPYCNEGSPLVQNGACSRCVSLNQACTNLEGDRLKEFHSQGSGSGKDSPSSKSSIRPSKTPSSLARTSFPGGQ